MDTKESYVFGTYDRTGNKASQIKIWHALVRDYTQRKLTKPADRIVALAGLAAEFQTRYPWLGLYLAGLWKDALPADLLWIVSRPWRLRDVFNVVEALSYLPTWSWIRVDHPIDHITRIDEEVIPTAYDFIVSDVVYGHLNSFGPFASVTRGVHIRGTGYLQQAVLIGDRLTVDGGKDLSIGYLAHVD